MRALCSKVTFSLFSKKVWLEFSLLDIFKLSNLQKWQSALAKKVAQEKKVGAKKKKSAAVYK